VLVTAVGPGIEEIRWAHPDLKIVPALRGWKVKESSDKLLIDLRIDLQSTKDAKANGYAIFTYESLLSESNSMSLASIKEKIGY